MIKLLLFGLLCGLGYQLVRAFGRPARRRQDEPSPPDDRARMRAVEAEFEEIETPPGAGTDTSSDNSSP